MYSKESTNTGTAPTSGVVLICFGKEIYFESTHILIRSIQLSSPNINITVIASKPKHELLQGVHTVQLPREAYHNRVGNFEPGRAKVAIYNLLPYDNNLIVDVDSYCLKDITSLIESLVSDWRPYQSHVSGMLNLNDPKSQVNLQWANMSQIYSKYEINPDHNLPAINSSIVFVRKSEEAKSIFETALTLITDFPFKLSELTWKWGGTQPDELYMNVSLAMHNYDPTMTPAMYFMYKSVGIEPKKVVEDYYFQSYYGGKGHTPMAYLTYLDSLVRKELGLPYKISKLINQKHANSAK